MDRQWTSRVPPPAVAAAALVVQRIVPGGKVSTPSRVAAVVLAAVSGAVAVTAVAGFRREGTTLDPTHPEQASALVTTGAHAASRNPMYVGLLGVVLAHAVWRRSWWALIPAAAFTGWLDRVQIPAEEEALEAKYGDAYRAYRDRVPRWIGLSRPSCASRV